ncbi:GFO_IDH_MocA domain-containing protein/GFO_IDH_MocA_C domain-containing protein [Cephalotus follicularis]|uniref:GFO_IDH_MocA domain-containing protein/GFO_IDH_MocA_C domain-containing protein n=1 Tax=Cephalotus follicularis TaxID=3775 RepID=A0A1Q3BXZ8_CEPFO|nr:GFO_IDH_MocA domain-containing protein/GFO_IDH_MocA_C domain-containing protein [Cephalotus follicularis]
MAAANDSTMKYGIIGVGMMGREHLINLHHLRNEGVAVVCIADPHLPSQQLALQLAQSFDWPIKVFTGHKELLDSGLCDVVIVSTPNMTHHQILLDIINHPKSHHVLVEKPLCTTVADCREVVAAARKRPDMLVQVGLEYRYMPPIAKLIEIVKSGILGQVKMVAIREHRFPFLVKVNNWNRFNANSGGTLVEKCCHFFDLMRLFAGANPVRVMASGAIDVNHKDEIYDGKVPDIIDNAYTIVEFDNGTRGMLDLCMFAEGTKNEQEISVVGDIGKGEAFVPESIVRFGTRMGGRDGVQTLKAEDDRIKYDGLHHGSSYLEHLNFLSAIQAKGGQGPAVDLHDGLISVAIGVAAQLSIEKGRFVTLEEVMDEHNLGAS